MPRFGRDWHPRMHAEGKRVADSATRRNAAPRRGAAAEPGFRAYRLGITPRRRCSW